MKKRVIAAALLAGALALSVPGGAIAAQNCGVLVCADANPAVTWSCTSTDFSGYDLFACDFDVTTAAGGSSNLSAPGSASYDGELTYDVTYDGGGTWFGPYPIDSASGSCNWPGLGEDSCGGGITESGTIVYYQPDFTCIGVGPFAFEYRLNAASSATATKSLPQLGVVETMSASDSASGKASDLGPTATCAFP